VPGIEPRIPISFGLALGPHALIVAHSRGEDGFGSGVAAIAAGAAIRAPPSAAIAARFRQLTRPTITVQPASADAHNRDAVEYVSMGGGLSSGRRGAAALTRLAATAPLRAWPGRPDVCTAHRHEARS